MARSQGRTVIGGAFFGPLWMGTQGVIPAALGQAVNAIIQRRGKPVARRSAITGIDVTGARTRTPAAMTHGWMTSSPEKLIYAAIPA